MSIEEVRSVGSVREEEEEEEDYDDVVHHKMQHERQ